MHSFFFLFCRILVVLESNPVISGEGGGGAHPLHPPLRSAPVPLYLQEANTKKIQVHGILYLRLRGLGSGILRYIKSI